MQNQKTVKLILEDGKTFTGKSFGYEKPVSGEVVFNTAMAGYPESLTDPSYKGQILVVTYPLVGNYGVPDYERENGMLKYFESEAIQVSGLIISDYSFEYSHWNAERSLSNWLTASKIPAIFDIDTRELTKILREKGTMLGKIVFEDEQIDYFDPNVVNLVDMVSVKEVSRYGKGKNKVVLVDCGVKNNIIRCLLKRDTEVIRVPWDYDFNKLEYDGLFLSNGPGNPKMCNATIENLKVALKAEKPIFGICLGSQLLALASGADTYKLKYGHRSHNQPVIEVGSEKCHITSQNHGYAVDGKSLNDDWELYFKNLNDGTTEGIKHKKKPFFSTQFHPEASSGPTDTEYLFDVFVEQIEAQK